MSHRVMEQGDGGGGAAAAATLIVKHLPEALPLDTLKRLFSHYGASDVRHCSAARLKNCAFVDFKDEALAARAQSQLHRLRFFGKILAVERAKPYSEAKPDKADSIATNREQAAKENAPPLPPPPLSCRPFHKLEPIAPSLGVDYPFPPQLEYAYPPPDGNILTNIVNALIAIPRFYTQVLHLMNKMNLPAPFRPALPTPPLPPPPPVPPPPKQQAKELSTDESELESSEEIESDFQRQQSEGDNLEADKGQARRKRAKADKKDVEDTGPKPTFLVPRERPVVKKHQPVLQINISTRGMSENIKVEPMRDEREAEPASETEKDEMTEAKTSATRKELEAGRMPLSEILVLPMFKNYAVGNPTPVLYIKNLAKDVSQDDLFYVFGAFLSNIEDAKAHLGVKLMQEGRMRGQAFVTFPSTELANDALNVAHGYVLKGKPMIIQFSRNPSSIKANIDSHA